MTYAEAAVEVLRETENPAVMWGDSGLLHMISDRAGRGHDGWRTEARVLDALARAPGELVPGLTGRLHGGRPLRIFYLPETAP